MSLQPPCLQGEYLLSSRCHCPAPYSGNGHRQPARDTCYVWCNTWVVVGWGIAPGRDCGRPSQWGIQAARRFQDKNRFEIADSTQLGAGVTNVVSDGRIIKVKSSTSD